MDRALANPGIFKIESKTVTLSRSKFPALSESDQQGQTNDDKYHASYFFLNIF